LEDYINNDLSKNDFEKCIPEIAEADFYVELFDRREAFLKVQDGCDYNTYYHSVSRGIEK
jgi:hypothetical protein